MGSTSTAAAALHNEQFILVIIVLAIVLAAYIGFRSGVVTALLEIVAGIVIANAFGFELPQVVETLSELGLVMLMFMTGVEVELSFLKHKAQDGIKIGLRTFAVTFIATVLITRFGFGYEWLPSLLFATGLSECSAGMVYSVLRRKGELGPRRRIILAASVVMEMLGIIGLTILLSDVSWIMGLLVLFIVVMRYVIPAIQKRYNIVYSATTDKLATKTIIAAVLIAAFLAHESGVDAVIAVFVLGVLLSGYTHKYPTLRKELEAISFGFLTPFFFFALGFSISLPAAIAVLPSIVILTAATFTITFLVSYFSARSRIPKRARAIGFLLNAPLAVGFVAATLGFEQGTLNEQQYLVLVGTVLLSSFIGVAFARYPSDFAKV